MSRYYTVLCEDLQAFVFIRRALINAGAEARKIFQHPYPDNRFNASGGGSPRTVNGYQVYACGSQHVRMNFPQVLASTRSQNKKTAAALVVHIDVDNSDPNKRTCAFRLDELSMGCDAASVPRPQPSDPLALLVPRREIETWIEFLLHATAVNEHTNYAKLTGCEADCWPAAEAFATHAKANTVPAGSPPSLVTGLSEFRRVI